MAKQLDFKHAIYPHNYPKRALSSYIRDLSDFYSQQNAEDYNEIREYASTFTQGRCFYCGKKLYKEENNHIIFIKNIQYDHLLPASLCGLYAKGNVIVACSSCNLEKSDMSVIEYYNQRLKAHQPTLYKSLDEVQHKISIFQEPYQRKFPIFMGLSLIGQEDPTLLSFEKVKKIFEENLSFPETLTSGTTNIQKILKSANPNFWLAFRNPENKIYQDKAMATISNYTSRIVSLFDKYSTHFSPDTDITKLSNKELTDWANSTLHLLALSSKSEHSKYSALFRLVFHELNMDSSNLLSYKSALYGVEQKDLCERGTWSWFNPNSELYKGKSKSSIYCKTGPIKKLHVIYDKLKGEQTTSINNLEQDLLTKAISQLESNPSTEKKTHRAMKFFKEHMYD